MTVPGNIPAPMMGTTERLRIVNAVTSTEESDATTHNVSMPSAVDEDDLLIIIMAFNAVPGTVAFPNFTKLFETAASPNDQILVVGYKQADGTEGGGTEDVTSVNLETSAHITYRIKGHVAPATQAPEVSTGATGASTTPDPDSLTPTGGPKQFLWIVGAMNSGNGNAITVVPSGYSNDQFSTSTGGSDVSVGAGTRINLASSENPGTFTAALSDEWAACTVAVHPA